MSEAREDPGNKPRGSPRCESGEPRGLSPGSSFTSPPLVAHVLLFAALLSLLTWKLLEPTPVPEEVAGGLTAVARFALAKSLHLGAYGLLAVLAGTLPGPRRWRWVLVGLLACHGAATELAQHLMAVGRTGTMIDVLIDWVGIAVGVLSVRAVRR